MNRKTVFLDRDGLINVRAAEHDYIKKREDFKFLPNVPEAIKRLNDTGFLVLVITSQRGIARGLMTDGDLEDIHAYMRTELEKIGAYVDKIYVCPHDNDSCNCRKPDIGLFLRAESDFSMDKEKSWMIGDSDTDVEAGKRYGVKTILTEDLLSAVNTILGE